MFSSKLVVLLSPFCLFYARITFFSKRLYSLDSLEIKFIFFQFSLAGWVLMPTDLNQVDEGMEAAITPAP
jgi:hypothetical protein